MKRWIIKINTSDSIATIQTALDMATLKKQPEQIDALRRQLYRQHPINHPNLQVLFLWACANGDVDIVKWFLNRKLDPNEVSSPYLQTTYHLPKNFTVTPLLVACIDAQETIIKILLPLLNLQTLNHSLSNYMELNDFNVSVLEMIFTLLPEPEKTLLANKLLSSTCSLQQLQVLFNNGAHATLELLEKSYIYQSLGILIGILRMFPKLNFQDATIIAAIQNSDPLKHLGTFYCLDLLREAELLTIFNLLQNYKLSFKIDTPVKNVFLKKIASLKNNLEANENSLCLLAFLEKNNVSFFKIDKLPLAQEYYLQKLLVILKTALWDSTNVFSKLSASIIAHHILPYLYPIEIYGPEVPLKNENTIRPLVSIQNAERYLSFKPTPKQPVIDPPTSPTVEPSVEFSPTLVA